MDTLANVAAVLVAYVRAGDDAPSCAVPVLGNESEQNQGRLRGKVLCFR